MARRIVGFRLGKKRAQVQTPPRLLPRPVAQLVKADIVSLVGHPLVARSSDNGEALAGAPTPVVSANVATATVIRDGIRFTERERSGTTSKHQANINHGFLGIHGFLDPGGPQLPYNVVAQDLVRLTAGDVDAWSVFGWTNFVTGTDEDTLVGVCWRADSVDQTWKAYVAEGTVAPVTVLHDEDSGVSSHGVARRLTIVLYGALHKVEFYIDGDLASTFTPSAVPGQMRSNGLSIGYRQITDAGAAAAEPKYAMYGGTNHAIMSMVAA